MTHFAWCFLSLLAAVSSLQIDSDNECRKCGHGAGHPWYSKLYCKTKADGEFRSLCNAVLISPWHVLTSTKCVKTGNLVFKRVVCVSILPNLQIRSLFPRPFAFGPLLYRILLLFALLSYFRILQYYPTFVLETV